MAADSDGWLSKSDSRSEVAEIDAANEGVIETKTLGVLVTCEGDLKDPDFPVRLRRLLGELRALAHCDLELRRVEPWNSVRVTLSVPRSAALRLRALAAAGAPQLRALGVLAVQLDGDAAVSLRLQRGREIHIATAQDDEPVAGPSNAAGSEVLACLGGLGRLLGDAVAPNSTQQSVYPITANVNSVPSVPNSPARDPQFKSPNTVCPMDGKIPQNIPTASPEQCEFPFGSMTQARVIHRKENTMGLAQPGPSSGPSRQPPQPLVFPRPGNTSPFIAPPPPYPNKAVQAAPNVAMSSPLLVNLLQNDGTGPQPRPKSVQKSPGLKLESLDDGQVELALGRPAFEYRSPRPPSSPITAGHQQVTQSLPASSAARLMRPPIAVPPRIVPPPPSPSPSPSVISNPGYMQRVPPRATSTSYPSPSAHQSPPSIPQRAQAPQFIAQPQRHQYQSPLPPPAPQSQTSIFSPPPPPYSRQQVSQQRTLADNLQVLVPTASSMDLKTQSSFQEFQRYQQQYNARQQAACQAQQSNSLQRQPQQTSEDTSWASLSLDNSLQSMPQSQLQNQSNLNMFKDPLAGLSSLPDITDTCDLDQLLPSLNAADLNLDTALSAITEFDAKLPKGALDSVLDSKLDLLCVPPVDVQSQLNSQPLVIGNSRNVGLPNQVHNSLNTTSHGLVTSSIHSSIPSSPSVPLIHPPTNPVSIAASSLASNPPSIATPTLIQKSSSNVSPISTLLPTSNKAASPVLSSHHIPPPVSSPVNSTNPSTTLTFATSTVVSNPAITSTFTFVHSSASNPVSPHIQTPVSTHISAAIVPPIITPICTTIPNSIPTSTSNSSPTPETKSVTIATSSSVDALTPAQAPNFVSVSTPTIKPQPTVLPSTVKPPTPPLTFNSKGKRRDYLINSLTGEMEPLPTESSSSETEEEQPALPPDPYFDALHSERSNPLFSDEENSCLEFAKKIEAPEKSDSETTQILTDIDDKILNKIKAAKKDKIVSKDKEVKTIPSKINKDKPKAAGLKEKPAVLKDKVLATKEKVKTVIPREKVMSLKAPPLKINPMVDSTDKSSNMEKEKIKLRLMKLEKSEPVINPIYKADVSFVNSQLPKKQSPGTPGGKPAPGSGPSNSSNLPLQQEGELRVPPLHISLRGRNSAVIKSSKREKKKNLLDISEKGFDPISQKKLKLKKSGNISDISRLNKKSTSNEELLKVFDEAEFDSDSPSLDLKLKLNNHINDSQINFKAKETGEMVSTYHMKTISKNAHIVTKSPAFVSKSTNKIGSKVSLDFLKIKSKKQKLLADKDKMRSSLDKEKESKLSPYDVDGNYAHNEGYRENWINHEHLKFLNKKLQSKPTDLSTSAVKCVSQSSDVGNSSTSITRIGGSVYSENLNNVRQSQSMDSRTSSSESVSKTDGSVTSDSSNLKRTLTEGALGANGLVTSEKRRRISHTASVPSSDNLKPITEFDSMSVSPPPVSRAPPPAGAVGSTNTGTIHHQNSKNYTMAPSHSCSSPIPSPQPSLPQNKLKLHRGKDKSYSKMMAERQMEKLNLEIAKPPSPMPEATDSPPGCQYEDMRLPKTVLPQGNIADMEAKFRQKLSESQSQNTTFRKIKTYKAYSPLDGAASMKEGLSKKNKQSQEDINLKTNIEPIKPDDLRELQRDVSLTVISRSPSQESQGNQSNVGQGGNSSRSPNSQAQGEDSGIESMDALSEKSPNQAGQSPHGLVVDICSLGAQRSACVDRPQQVQQHRKEGIKDRLDTVSSAVQQCVEPRATSQDDILNEPNDVRPSSQSMLEDTLISDKSNKDLFSDLTSSEEKLDMFNRDNKCMALSAHLAQYNHLTDLEDMGDIEAELAKMEGLHTDHLNGENDLESLSKSDCFLGKFMGDKRLEKSESLKSDQSLERILVGNEKQHIVMSKDLNENKNIVNIKPEFSLLDDCCNVSRDGNCLGNMDDSKSFQQSIHFKQQDCNLKFSESNDSKKKIKLERVEALSVNETVKSDNFDPLPLRVKPALYTYSNLEKTRDSDASDHELDEQNTSQNKDIVKADEFDVESSVKDNDEITLDDKANKDSAKDCDISKRPLEKVDFPDKSLLEQLLIEIPTSEFSDKRLDSLSPSVSDKNIAKSCIRTRSSSKLNSPADNLRTPKHSPNLLKIDSRANSPANFNLRNNPRTGSVDKVSPKVIQPTNRAPLVGTKRRRQESESSNHSSVSCEEGHSPNLQAKNKKLKKSLDASPIPEAQDAAAKLNAKIDAIKKHGVEVKKVLDKSVVCDKKIGQKSQVKTTTPGQANPGVESDSDSDEPLICKVRGKTIQLPASQTTVPPKNEVNPHVTRNHKVSGATATATIGGKNAPSKVLSCETSADKVGTRRSVRQSGVVTAKKTDPSNPSGTPSVDSSGTVAARRKTRSAVVDESTASPVRRRRASRDK